MDPLSIAAIAVIAFAAFPALRRKPNPRAFWRAVGRVVLALLAIPLAFLAWYTVAAIPVSVAIILGAIIIVCGMRSSTGRMRWLMVAPAEREPQHPLYSEADRSVPASPVPPLWQSRL